MDKQTLLFQNRKLTERIEQRRKAEAELLVRIEQLEKRQITDDAVLCVINRYWNQLDEDLRIMLSRFDSETTDEDEHKNQSDATTSFLAQVSSWDNVEIEERLRQRVGFSTRAVGKLLLAFDRIIQRNERLSSAIQIGSSSCSIGPEAASGSASASPVSEDAAKAPKLQNGIGGAKAASELSPTGTGNGIKKLVINDEVKKLNFDMQMETSRLQALITQLEERHRKTNLENMHYFDRVAELETEIAELKHKLEDVEWDLVKSREKEENMDRYLQDALAKLKNGSGGRVDPSVTSLSSSSKKQLNSSDSKNDQHPRGFAENTERQELEEQRELATNRLSELELLQSNYEKSVREVDKLRMELSTLPESVIVQSAEYKCLQSQFSVLYNESMQMRTQLEQVRTLLQQSKTMHLRQIEEMESAELTVQKKLRSELIQLEDALTKTRREYEMLRIEFDQTVAANEQTGPINREMRLLIASLQEHNSQLKGELARFKKKLEAKQEKLNRWRGGGRGGDVVDGDGEEDDEIKSVEEGDDEVLTNGFGRGGLVDSAASASSAAAPAAACEDEAKKESDHSSDSSKNRQFSSCIISSKKRRKSGASSDKGEEGGGGGGSLIFRLRSELTEARLMLDMYKTAPKEQRDKVELMAVERRLKSELTKVKDQLTNARLSLQDQSSRQRRGSSCSNGHGSCSNGHAAEDEGYPIKKIKKLEEELEELEKSLAAKEQEEAMLLKEMEVTGQAFEDMQDQNVRLMQQLREKDDANFKLMGEKIKSNQVHKLMREEKQVFHEQVTTIHNQLSAQNVVVRKLEEKERILQTNLLQVEKESSLRQQAMELHKRKALESTQAAADLKLHLGKYTAQLKELQASVGEKNAVTAKEAFKQRRLTEELNHLRKKMERMKKFEMASSADEVLTEELKEYKEMMTCPSCKVKRKDAVLTKCFHVFCFSCLKTRYETRQRKCPKCNAGFGAHDFHRIYIS